MIKRQHLLTIVLTSVFALAPVATFGATELDQTKDPATTATKAKASTRRNHHGHHRHHRKSKKHSKRVPNAKSLTKQSY